MAVAAARTNGYAVNDATAKQQAMRLVHTSRRGESARFKTSSSRGQADTINYILLGLAADDYPPDTATDAQAIWLKRRQAPDGHWPVTAIRPPLESNDIEVDRGLDAGASRCLRRRRSAPSSSKPWIAHVPG